MTLLERRLRRLGRGLWRGIVTGLGAAVVAAGLLLLGLGSVTELAAGRGGTAVLALVVLTSGLLVYQIGQRLSVGPHAPRLELEAGGALVLGTYFLLAALGGAHSPLHPLVYALAAFVVSYHRPRVALPLLGLMLLCEALLCRAEPARIVLHGFFLLLFAALHQVFYRAGVLQKEREHEHRVRGELARIREEACDFRLLSARSGQTGRSRAEEEVILAQGAVEMIHKNLRFLLQVLKRSLHLHTCALLWPSADGELFRVKELCSDSEGLCERELAADAGVLGTIGKNRRPLRVGAPKPSHLAYYRHGAALPPIGAFAGVPLLEQEALCGVLCADRTAPGAPFTDEEEELLRDAAEQVLRILRSERVFAAVERGRYEHERLYRASERLNGALTPEQVHATAFAAVREVCDFDFGAIVRYDRQARKHTVAAVSPPDPKSHGELLGKSFPDNAGLCAMAVKNRHALPKDGVLRDRAAPIFAEDAGGAGHDQDLVGLIVLPLVCGGEAVGTMVFGSARRDAFGRDKREMLGVIANQVAVALDNARMYQAMEAMATTDGLTGLANRRAFQERFAEMLQRAERQGKPLTLLMTDIDHFKRVNDTHGHQVGDLVLRRVAQVVQSCVRKIDLAARYGGEEFAVVLETIDQGGGRQLAERVRQEVQRLWFHSDKGPFQCTLSLGMATFPGDGADGRALVEHADQALYYAKHHGRNQAVAYADMRELNRARAAS